MEIPIDGDSTDFAKVTTHLRNRDGLPIIRVHNNSILDTIRYEVEYKVGHKAFLASNTILENMFVQVDG